MSKMGSLGAIGFSLALVSLTQIPFIKAQDCSIVSVSSPASSALLVKWNRYAGATNYLLDLRVINSTTIAPVVVTKSALFTQQLIQGLRPGTNYVVTLKVFVFYSVRCVATELASTVPTTSQITYFRALSSTSIEVQWSQVSSADGYYLIVQSQDTGQMRNMTFTNHSAVVRNLQPLTSYLCYVYTFSKAGLGKKSEVKTISTLVQPPENVRAVQTGKRSARVSWQPVDKVLLYEVRIRDVNDPNSKPFEGNVSHTQLDIQNILPCSTYLISVSSVNTFLQPGESRDIRFTTNTLSPVTSISVDYSCTTLSAVVSWPAVFGADSYRATAISNGTTLSCTGQGPQCEIRGVGCGQNYTVQVTTLSDTCETTANKTTTFQTVPCPPENLELFRECASNVIIFSWEHTSQSDYYLARAVDTQGEVQECLTTDNSCFFTNTVCGRGYTFTVQSSSGNCNSQRSSSVEIRTAPCMPTNVQTSADCKSDLMISKWDHAEGALEYTVEAWGNTNGGTYYNCSSVTTSCAMENIPCGEHLTIYITASDDDCTSPRKLAPVAETVPCVPQNVLATMDCGVDSITMTWGVAHGAIFYIGTVVDHNGVVHTCITFNLMCQITGLQCGTNYTAFIIATNLKCNSSDSERVIVETAACPPDHIVATVDCAANQVLISWQSQPELNSFTATIIDADGGLLSCSTAEKNNCSISSLKCSQLYAVSVSYHDGICPGIPSKDIYIDSVPCGPTNVQTSVDCASGELTIGWNASRRAEAYTTIISDGDGQRMYCNSTEPRCSINTLECGQEYAVKVMSINGTCLSLPSRIVTVGPVPCIPTNVVAERDCGDNSVNVQWQASPGTRNYTVVAVDNNGRRTLCSSNGTTCRLEDLLCSQVYNITMVAVGENCSSMESAVLTLHTAPCPPSQLTVSVDCTSNSAMLTWDTSPNTAAYSAKAVGTDGHNVSCETVANSGCQLEDLHCGQEYIFTVSASDGSCNSPDSQAVNHTTAPCAPQSVVNTVNCVTNVLTVSWAPGSIPVNYTATALVRNGTELSCTTEGSSCEVTGLQCGQQYNLTVHAVSSRCEGPSSARQTVLAVPCVPANIHGDLQCSSNTLQASWDVAAGAVRYATTLTGAGGFSTSCHTAHQRCFFPNLQCAQQYSFTVVASNLQCNSSMSTGVSVITAPCDPANVSAVLHCNTSTATVSWGASAGAVNYTVILVLDDIIIIIIVVNNTSCELSQLQCGQLYTVTVLAGDGSCNSTTLATTTIQTAPCSPVILDPLLDCVSNHALISWAEDEDIVSFMVNVTSSRGHSTSCSSNTNSSSCVLDDLQCGQTYTGQGVAQGEQCLSEPSNTFQIVTAPCTPTNVDHQYTCGTSIVLLSWDETLGRERFYAQINSADNNDACDTTETHCSLTSLRCGLLYNVTVSAMAAHCNSSRPATAQIETAPCAPQNPTASLVCNNNTARVSWQASTGAVQYKVKALGRNSDAKHCTTNTTSCDLPNMHCAQTYEITITPFSEVCMGFESPPFTFDAGPCPPAQVAVSLACEGIVGSVSWLPALTADMYVATATAEDGHIHTCSTNDTGCSFTDLHCGENYAVTVITIERGCQSEPSAPVILQSAICPPTGVTGVLACRTNDINVTWDQSPRSGVTYMTHCESKTNVTHNHQPTTGMSYLITGLPCGESFNITVAARDSVCTSTFSQAIVIETAPCPPTNVTTRVLCGTNRGILTWDPSASADTYVATMTGAHGHVVSCSSNTTSCSVKLDCGNHYSAVVLASTSACNSSTGATTQFDSAPCLPDNVEAQLDCNLNSFMVQWRASQGFVSSYMALAIGSNGTLATCNSPTTSCTIQSGLQCGVNYSIAVTTASINCGTIEGSDYQLQSAPCNPERPMVTLECSTNVAVVSWENSGPDQVNVVTAVNGQGHNTTCNSTGTTCTFSQLSCGEAYALTVVGHTELCPSQPSSTLNLLTAPCVPTHLTVNVDCQTGITVVTWDSARGATMYTVYARGDDGHNATCTDSDTTCAFSNLACGQDYTITVEAHRDTCIGMISDPIIATTVPCPLTGLGASVDCSTDTAVVSWTPGRGILYYNASAEGFDITHHLTCSTNGSACNISSLQCGQRYRISVRSEGGTCPSPALEWKPVNTAPCPPMQLRVNSSCDSDSISVSWEASQGSLTYMAVAENTQGHRLSCSTATTSCQMSGLLCGTEYQVYTTGIDEKCTGARSATQVVRMAPCVPQDIETHLDCLPGVLNVTWQESADAHSYHAIVESSEGHVTLCDTHEGYCTVPNMQCGLNYSVVVMACDEACNSSQSPPQQVTTAPCPPETFFADFVDCASNDVSIIWNQSAPGVLYAVSALDPRGNWWNCSTTNTSCHLGILECGTVYNVTITPSRDGCMGRTSPYLPVRTAPCVPRLIDVEMDCLSESAWVIFEESAGADIYVIAATDSNGHVQRVECTSTVPGDCVVPHMLCGQNITVTVNARDLHCSSVPSNAIMTETAPCAPQIVRAVVGCENRTLSATWTPSNGSVLYTATLERTDGETSCCTSADTSCDITDLPCGEMYVLLVTAEGRTCNSSQSIGSIVRTEPCIPQNLQANLSCSNNVASMSWNSSRGGQQYRVEAVGDDGHMHQCSSHETTCDLTDLHCGQYYTATVVAEDSDCTSNQSGSVQIKTVPCTPANISGVWDVCADCEVSTLNVSWSESSGADIYIAKLEDSYGQSTNCQAMTEGSCNMTGLNCGQIYHISVVSSDGYCDSPPTDVLDVYSVPCKVTRIKAVMDCQRRTALLSWYRAEGAVSYRATATTVSGHAVTCTTTMTHCELGGLACAQSYSISVQALGGSLSSMAHMTGQLVTEPCVPNHITTSYSLNIGQVTWDVAAGAENYSVQGVTPQGHMVSCNTTDTNCATYNMACNQIYNVTVTAHNQACYGVSTSAESAITTEPCPPNDVQARVLCDSHVGVVSWEISSAATSYVAYLDGRNGHSLSCHTTHTYCNIAGIQCGTVYYTKVVAMGGTLNSTDSTTVLLVAPACEAENVEASLDNDMAFITWTWINGAESYRVTATGRDGERASCETEDNHCNVTELPCGQTYNISLTAINDNCETTTDTGVSFRTGPCKLLRVGVDLQCGTSTANMYWEETEGVDRYLATATSSMGVTLHCNSTDSSCQFTGLDCGETYQFSVTGQICYCDLNDCVCINSSEPSNTVEIQTEPCQPDPLTLIGSCNNETVVLDWAEARGASAYVVSVTGNLRYTTAFQTNETSLETVLPCGQIFTITVKAQDGRCESPVSQPTEFRTAPCVPRHVSSYTPCEDSLGAITWAESEGAESYTAIAMGQDGHTHMCNSNTTGCTWDDLHCGEHYVIYVIANDYMCSSTESNSTSITMAPCVPQNLESSLDCTTKVGSLTWDDSEAAESYIVKAETNGGHVVQLGATNTSAMISELLCGQEYFLSVQAISSVCRSAFSPPARLTTEPCPPTKVSSRMDCVSNIASVTWTGSAGAEFYIATVTHEDGQSESCMSNNEKCGLPNLRCGRNYTVTVAASNQQCSSDPSEVDTLQSVPCIPTDVEVAMDCSNNTAEVSWNVSQGALSYKMGAVSLQGHTSQCESTEPGCTLTNLTCGQTYYVRVEALDDICSSLPSQAVQFNSVPCTPNITAVVLDCFTNSALLEWAYAEGALSYATTAQSADGHVSNCTTNFTNCELTDLQCGQTYTVDMVASNSQCNSYRSTSVQVISVPCRPEAVMTALDCATNFARVSWQGSSGADSYVVQAFGVEEHMSGCETDSHSCVMSDLLCGFIYNISVIAINNRCNVSESATTLLHTAPCVPNQLEANVDCESGAVSVSWERSKGADSYTAVAQGNGGYESTCNSTTTTCLFSNLLCGLSYDITVRASDGTCDSPSAMIVQIDTVLCTPQRVAAERVCSNDTALVSWERDEDVNSTVVFAVGPDGHKTQCNSSGNSCQLPSLHCGQSYNLTVTAQDGRCDNSNAYATLQSVPCSPTDTKASLRCHSNSAAVTWERASGAMSYSAVGVSADGSHSTECNNTMTYCDLSSLLCGQTYNVSVFGQDESCTSAGSDTAYMRTAPCTPQDVAVDMQCAAHVMVVSWSPNPDAESFNVVAFSSTGVDHFCNSSSSSCSIENLPCGHSYSITVVAMRNGCESKPSTAVEISSAPCVPRNIERSLDCISNSAWVSWDGSNGALSYTVLAHGNTGHNSSCTTTTTTNCNVPDLECATLYTFHVTAANIHCLSAHSTTVELETGPCALTSITAETECNSDIILVEWDLTEDSPLFLVTAEGHDQSLISCNSSSSFCELTGAQCDMQYSVVVSASSDKCSTLRSPPRKVHTAPCAPENVAMVPLCQERGMAVSWARSTLATSYMLTATGGDGDVRTCNTSVNNCTLADLHCGQSYTVSITASANNCTSPPSADLSIRTVPCDPSDLSVELICETNSAVLSWGARDDSVQYFVFAERQDGDTLYCDSADTSCLIQGLECGAMYNFSVEASNGVCNTSRSVPLLAGAAPCAPATVNVRLQHIQLVNEVQWAMVSWSPVNCTVEYLAEINGEIQGNPQALLEFSSYWLERPYFEFPMPCSTTYNITVRARNSAGVSEPSHVVSGITAPCTPEHVTYTGDNESAVLSWDASVFADNYSVYNVSGSVRVEVCSTTTELSCQLTNFQPDAIEVTASNAGGESIPNGNITGPVLNRRRRDVRDSQFFGSSNDPSVPRVLNITVIGVCLYVEWTPVMDATQYKLIVKEEQATRPFVVITVDEEFYTVCNLKPRTNYCFMVSAKTINQSRFSKPECRITQ